jgi:hypothetical protein
MIPFIPLLIVTSLTEVFVEGMEYDDTFHTFSHCDLIVWSIYYNEKRYERCHRTPSPQQILLSVRSQWEKVWKVSLYSIPSINTSYSEVTMRKGMKGVIVLHPFNKYFSQRGHYKQRYERYHRTPSLYDVFIERMEYDNTFHTSAHCDLSDWSFYWGDGVRWHLSHLYSLWPHCMKYLLRRWSTMITFITQYIFHRVRSKWEKVWRVSSYTISSINNSYNKVTMSRGVKGNIVSRPVNKYFDTFHTFSHCDLTVWSNYWGDGVWWQLSYLFSLWPHCMKYLLRGWSTITQ